MGVFFNMACNRPPAAPPYAREVTLWRVRNRLPWGYVTAHLGEVSCLVFSPDGRTLVTGGFDRTVRPQDLSRAAPPPGFGGSALVAFA